MKNEECHPDGIFHFSLFIFHSPHFSFQLYHRDPGAAETDILVAE